MRSRASWFVYIAQLLAPYCPLPFHLLFTFSRSLSPLLHIRILPPAIKITVATFLLTAKCPFRFDCTSTDMNGRGKKVRSAKRSMAIEGFCVLLKLRRFFSLTCNSCLFFASLPLLMWDFLLVLLVRMHAINFYAAPVILRISNKLLLIIGLQIQKYLSPM